MAIVVARVMLPPASIGFDGIRAHVGGRPYPRRAGLATTCRHTITRAVHITLPTLNVANTWED